MSASRHRVLPALGYLLVALALVLLFLAWLNQRWSMVIVYVVVMGLLAMGYWTWWRIWRGASEERRDRQRRWGIRKRVDTGDRVNADGE